MNQIQTVVRWFVNEEIKTPELRECLSNLHCTPSKIDKIIKRAVVLRASKRVSKYHAASKKAQTNTQEEV